MFKSVFKMLLDKENDSTISRKENSDLLLKYLVSIVFSLVNWEVAIAGLYQALIFIWTGKLAHLT